MLAQGKGRWVASQTLIRAKCWLRGGVGGQFSQTLILFSPLGQNVDLEEG